MAQIRKQILFDVMYFLFASGADYQRLSSAEKSPNPAL